MYIYKMDFKTSQRELEPVPWRMTEHIVTATNDLIREEKCKEFVIFNVSLSGCLKLILQQESWCKLILHIPAQNVWARRHWEDSSHKISR